MTDHTPGPWQVVQAEYAQIITASLPRGEVLVAEVRPAWDSGLANARLIAAAPELLEALRWFVDDEPCRLDHEGYCQTHGVTKPCLNQAAGAVILKAEGRKS